MALITQMAGKLFWVELDEEESDRYQYLVEKGKAEDISLLKVLTGGGSSIALFLAGLVLGALVAFVPLLGTATAATEIASAQEIETYDDLQQYVFHSFNAGTEHPEHIPELLELWRRIERDEFSGRGRTAARRQVIARLSLHDSPLLLDFMQERQSDADGDVRNIADIAYQRIKSKLGK